MRKTRSTLIVMTLCMTTFSGIAQDDPWWKNLFKKETVKEIEEDTPAVDEKAEIEVEEKDTIPVIIPATREPGMISVTTPYSLDTLNEALIENPAPIHGFRIQIFFGNLANAKQERSSFMAAFDDQPCYLVQNVPNFAVRVGDFRTELEAHKHLQELKGQFPSAYIVPDEIAFPQLNGPD